MADVDDNDVKISLKPPQFSGVKSEWEYIKIAMKAYLSVSGLGEILMFDGAVARDNVDLAPDAEGIRMRKVNCKAAGILFQSITHLSPEQKKAVEIIKPHFTGDDGINPGHFKNAWDALTHWYKVVKKQDKDKLRDSFYAMKMKVDEQPSEFILKISDLRKELE